MEARFRKQKRIGLSKIQSCIWRESQTSCPEWKQPLMIWLICSGKKVSRWLYRRLRSLLWRRLMHMSSTNSTYASLSTWRSWVISWGRWHRMRFIFSFRKLVGSWTSCLQQEKICWWRRCVLKIIARRIRNNGSRQGRGLSSPLSIFYAK